MTEPLQSQVSYFNGVLVTTPFQKRRLAQALDDIRRGTYKLRVQSLRALSPAAYTQAKRALPAFTPCGTFARRDKAHLQAPSGIVHGDLDHLPDLQAARQALVHDLHTVYCFTSPSGEGLKVGVLVAPVADDVAYKQAWQAVAEYHQQHYGMVWDPSGKDICRLCFVSWDPECFINPEARRFEYSVPDMVVPPPRPQTPRPTWDIPSERRQRYAQQALDTATRIIDASVLGNRHQARTKAAYLLGGYVAGGVLDEAEAHAALEEAVTRNTADFARSMQTIDTCLEAGMKKAISLEDLEAERQAWLQEHRAPPHPTAEPRQNGPPDAPPGPEDALADAAAALATLALTDVAALEDTRPVIQMGADLTRMVDACQAALLALPAGPVLFQRARRLSLMARGVKPPRWLHRPADAPVIVEAPLRYLEELTTRAARWEKYDARAKKWHEVPTPRRIVEHLQARPEQPFPLLEGIIHSPTLRPDGSVLDQPGYDVDTALWYDSNGTTFPPLPPRPTFDDARTAIGCLQEVVINFPFTAPWHFSAWVAATLSVVCRYTIMGCVPLFGVTAPVQRSGKTMLADTIGLIGTGRPAARWSQVIDEDEWRKRLLSLALDGDPLVCIDNVTTPLESGAMAAALTGLSYKDRLLGVNQTKEAPWYAVVLCTGNNVQYGSDITSRVVPIAIDPECEHPEERTGFAHPDLLAWVQQERPRLVIAALTIVKAYCEADRPAVDVKPYGGFDAWSNLIRNALVWAGEADPCAGRQEVAETSNPEFEMQAALVHAWQACYKTSAATLKQAVGDIGLYANYVQGKPGNAWNDLHDALGAFDAHYDGKTLNTRAIGNRLPAFARRVIDGKRLVQAGTYKHAVQWRVDTMTRSQPGIGAR